MPRQPYPLILSLAAALTTGLGLMAAALGVKWGSPPPAGDALPEAWLYVNVLWAFTILIIWPAMALWPRAEGRHVPVFWQAAGMIAGALPALAVGAYVSNATLTMIIRISALQLGGAFLILAILRLRARFSMVGDVLVGILGAFTLLGPIAAFLWLQFFPRAAEGWFAVLPLVNVVQVAGAAAPGGPDGGSPWAVAGVYVAGGAILLFVAGIGGAQRKAPGTEVPGA
jgi:hypothetical protein